MTQKSESRKQRDLAKAAEAGKIKEEGRKGWDELNTLSNEIFSLLAFPLTMAESLRNKALLSFLTKEEGKELADAVRLLQADMTTMLGKYKAIREKHKGKAGYEADMNEVMITYGLVDEYVHFQAEYDAFILPTQADITQHISNAEIRQLAEYKRQQAEKAAAEATPVTEAAPTETVTA